MKGAVLWTSEKICWRDWSGGNETRWEATAQSNRGEGDSEKASGNEEGGNLLGLRGRFSSTNIIKAG